MFSVAVPMFVASVALAATEASGVSITQPLKGSNAPAAGVYKVTIKEHPQPYNDPYTGLRVQFWDATFFFSKGQCPNIKNKTFCTQDIGCKWLDGQCSGNNTCNTNLVGISPAGHDKTPGPSGKAGIVTPSGSVVPRLHSDIMQSVSNEKQDCAYSAFSNILPAGLVTVEAAIGSAGFEWYSPLAWQNKHGGDLLSLTFSGSNPDGHCLSTTGGTQCSLDMQGLGVLRNAELDLYMCAIDRRNAKEFQISKDKCTKLGGQGVSLAPPSKSKTWPWEKNETLRYGTTLIDIVIVNLGDL